MFMIVKQFVICSKSDRYLCPAYCPHRKPHPNNLWPKLGRCYHRNISVRDIKCRKTAKPARSR
jgi:hypothetical protein